MLSKLAQCILFQGVSIDEIHEAFNTISYQHKSYDSEIPIAHLGDECDKLFILLDGEVRGEMTDKTGKIIKIEDIKAPSPLASAFIFGQQNRFPVTITTSKPSDVIIIYKDQLLILFQSNKQILANFLTLISTRAQFLTQKIKFLSFGTIKEKLAHYIISQLGEQLHSFPMTKTQQQLADLFGIQRPSLARALKELQDEGIISINQKTITVINKKELQLLLH